MADIAQLDIMKQGSEIWKQWRRKNPSLRVDLSYADLRGQDFIVIDLQAADLRGANLTDVSLLVQC